MVIVDVNGSLDQHDDVRLVLENQDKTNRVLELLEFGKNFSPAVVNKKLGSIGTSKKLDEIIAKRYNNKAFFIFPSQFFVRKRLIQFIESTWFERSILFLIILNCIFLALYNPLDPDDIRNTVLSWSELFFQLAFTMEMCLKMLGMGIFLHQYSYFRDPWNILDFFIVVTGYLGMLNLGGNFTIFRAFRLLRPLRAVTGVGDLRLIINALLKSIPMLINTLILSLFFWILYGIIGLQLFSGSLRNRCFHKLTRKIHKAEYLFCGLEGSILTSPCPEGFVCLTEASNPNHGVTSFDNILLSMLAVFQSVTLEGWSAIQYQLMDSSNGFISLIYFTSLVLLGGFFIVNLATAVIEDNFSTFAKREKEILLEQLESSKKGDVIVKENGKIQKIKAFLNHVYDGIADIIYFIPFQKKIQGIFRKIVRSKLFNGFFVTITILNTITLGIEYYNMPTWLQETLSIFNYTYTGLFTIEFLLKFYGLGFKEYVMDPLNIFDAVVVAFSFIELGLEGVGGLTVLRTFRLVRVVKLARISTSMQKLLTIVVKSLQASFMLCFLFILMIFIFALLGMQLFGGGYHEGKYDWADDDHEFQARWHFDDLFTAMLSSFIVGTSEDWHLLMFDGIRASERIVDVIYFVALFIIGNFVVLNVFLAVMFSQFDDDDDDDDNSVEKNLESQVKNSTIGEFIKSIVFFTTVRKRCIIDPDVLSAIQADCTPPTKTRKRDLRNLSSPKLEELLLEENEYFDISSPTKEKKLRFRPLLLEVFLGDFAFFILPNNIFRRALKRMVSSKVFEIFILFSIMVSTVGLILEHPYLPPDSPMMQALNILNLILTIFFTIESILKMVAFGFFFMKGAYLRDWWNVMDFFIVIIGLLSLVLNSPNLQALRAMRLLRTLRPLRIINRISGLKIVVDTLFTSIRPMITVAIFSTLVFIVFGIMGVQLYGGRLRECSDPMWSNRDLCIEAGEKWVNPSMFHFDNLLNSIMTLLVIASLEGYMDTMFRCIDTLPLVNLKPIRNSRPEMALFFVAHVAVLAIFIPSLFLGVLIDNYSKLKREKKVILMTASQKQWVEVQKTLLENKPPYIPKPPRMFFRRLRLVLYRIVMHPVFEIFIFAMILVNVLAMTIEFHQQPQAMTLVLRILNYVFTGVFTIEAILKLIAFNPIGYFRDWWNVFDFSIVSISLIAIGLGEIQISIGFTSIFRILRAVRVFRVVKSAQGLSRLLRTLFLSLPSLVNVSALLLLLYIIFGVIGMRLFSRIPFGHELYGINKFQNFKDFHSAIILLFRATTGEDFHVLMDELATTEGRSCVKRGNCSDPPTTIIYFMAYLIFGYWVLPNIFVAVILENFSGSDSSLSDLDERCMQNFLSCWIRHDPNMTLYMDVERVPMFLLEIGEPLGVNVSTPMYRKHLRLLINAIDLSEFEGKVHYQEVVLKLAQIKYGVTLPDKVMIQYKQRWNKLIPKKKDQQRSDSIQLVFAAMKVQQFWRKRVIEQRLQRKNRRNVKERIAFDDDLSEVKSYDENFDPVGSNSDTDSNISIMSLMKSHRSNSSGRRSNSSERSRSNSSGRSDSDGMEDIASELSV